MFVCCQLTYLKVDAAVWSLTNSINKIVISAAVWSYDQQH